MNDTELAQKFLIMREKMTIANKKYRSTANGKAKSAANQRNFYHTHSQEDGFMEQRRQKANAFYATNEPYRLKRQENARLRYYKVKYGPESETATKSETDETDETDT